LAGRPALRDAAGMGDEIRPAQYERPPSKEQIPYEILAQIHRVRVAAELLAGVREVAREHGADVETLERVEQHLVWCIDKVTEWAQQRRADGWAPPPPPRPDLRGVQGADPTLVRPPDDDTRT